MLDFIVSIIVIVLALSMLGGWIGRMSVRRNWSFPPHVSCGPRTRWVYR